MASLAGEFNVGKSTIIQTFQLSGTPSVPTCLDK